MIPGVAMRLQRANLLKRAGIANLVDKGIAQRQAAARYLKSLVELAVPREMQVGKEKLFLHPRLLQLLKDDGNRVAIYGE